MYHLQDRLQRVSLRDPELEALLDFLWSIVEALWRGHGSPLEIADRLSRMIVRLNAPIEEYNEGNWASGDTRYKEEELTLGESQYIDEEFKLKEGPYNEEENRQLGKSKYGEEKWEFQEYEEFRLKEIVEAELAEDELGYEEVRWQLDENKELEAWDEEEIDGIEWMRALQEVDRLKRLEEGMAKAEPESNEIVVSVTEVKLKAVTIEAEMEECDKAADPSQIDQGPRPNTTEHQPNAGETVVLPMNFSITSDARSSVKRDAVVSVELLTRIRAKTSRHTGKSQTFRRAKTRVRAQKLRGIGILARWREWIEMLTVWVQKPVDHLSRALDLRLEDEVLSKANRKMREEGS